MCGGMFLADTQIPDTSSSEFGVRGSEQKILTNLGIAHSELLGGGERGAEDSNSYC